MTIPRFGWQQFRIMLVLWERGRATAREITEKLNREEPIAHSTVQALLRQLERKGAITASATDSGGRTGSDSISITVGTSTPEVTVDSITPDTMPRGTSIDAIIAGSGFQAGASVTFENGKVPAPTADVTSVDGTTIEATVTVPSKAKVGVSWDVRVTNPDSSSGVLVDGLTVTR